MFSRITEHKNKIYRNSFTAKYNCNKLVYYEMYSTIEEAIGIEKRLKKWNRAWKIELIEKNNPKWLDLYKEDLQYINCLYKIVRPSGANANLNAIIKNS